MTPNLRACLAVVRPTWGPWPPAVGLSSRAVLEEEGLVESRPGPKGPDGPREVQLTEAGSAALEART
ncbi:MAG TPA: hypothetical protein VGL73_04290 [Caulobacteraceae bacterium]|jgi:hypothetical protein